MCTFEILKNKKTTLAEKIIIFHDFVHNSYSIQLKNIYVIDIFIEMLFRKSFKIVFVLSVLSFSSSF